MSCMVTDLFILMLDRSQHMGQAACTHETDCLSHRCSANEHASQGTASRVQMVYLVRRAMTQWPATRPAKTTLRPMPERRQQDRAWWLRATDSDGVRTVVLAGVRDQFVEDGRCFDCPEISTVMNAVIARGDSACTDIDECESEPCDVHATCTNRFGGFSCRCAPGFEGDDWL